MTQTKILLLNIKKFTASVAEHQKMGFLGQLHVCVGNGKYLLRNSLVRLLFYFWIYFNWKLANVGINFLNRCAVYFVLTPISRQNYKLPVK